MVGFGEVTGFLVQAVSEPVKLGWVIFGVLLLLIMKNKLGYVVYCLFNSYQVIIILSW